MSSRLTQKGTPMIESQTLQLVLDAARVNDLTSRYLSDSLKERGYKFATPSALSFLSTLECGVNYGSEIARNLGVSRQMVAKTVKELCLAGYLAQEKGIGKQKKIVFTITGEQLMSEARQLLANIDKALNDKLGEKLISTTVVNLKMIQELMLQLNNT